MTTGPLLALANFIGSYIAVLKTHIGTPVDCSPSATTLELQELS